MRSRWSVLLLRGTATTLTVLGIAQAVLAGGFLGGRFDMLIAHLGIGLLMVALSLVQIAVVFPVVRSGGPRSLPAIGVAVLVLLILQAGLGKGRERFDVVVDFARFRHGQSVRLITDFRHPVHVHLNHFQVIGRNGFGPGPHDGGWKDTVDVRPAEAVEIVTRFTDYPGAT